MNGARRPQLAPSPARRPDRPRGLVSAIVTMNAGLLVTLLTSPNSGRPNAVLAGIGIAIVIAGIALALKYALDARRGRNASTPGDRP